MTTYLILNAMFTGFMCIVLKTNDWIGGLLRFNLALTSLGSAFYAAQMLGYIVKV